MIYRFKSKACADLIVLGPVGDRLLRIAGREPAARGIFEVRAMPTLIAALEAAVAADESGRRAASSDDAAEPDDSRVDKVSLGQRAWPLIEMLRRAHQDEEPVVWGV